MWALAVAVAATGAFAPGSAGATPASVGAPAAPRAPSAPTASSSVSAAEAALESATAARRRAEERLADRQRRRDELLAEVERLGALDVELTEELADARRQMREYAVAAYIDGGRSAVFRSTLSIEQAQALSWQSSIAAGGTQAASRAAERYRALKDDNSPQQVAAAEELDRAEDAVEDARFDAIQAAAHERDAEARLAEERAASAAAAAAAAAAREQEAAERRAAAQQRAQREAEQLERTTSPPFSAGPSTTSGAAPVAAPPTSAAPPPPPAPAPPTSVPSGNPTPWESATLARIRACESGGNYSIVSASGRYRGAYQFDTLTWRSVGGSGDPAAATPAEQDYRALLLLRMRGTRPWPHCGR